MMSQQNSAAYNQASEQTGNRNPDPKQEVQNQDTHTIAQNPNPRANENIRNAPFEKEGNTAEQTGTEITDGESG